MASDVVQNNNKKKTVKAIKLDVIMNDISWKKEFTLKIKPRKWLNGREIN